MKKRRNLTDAYVRDRLKAAPKGTRPRSLYRIDPKPFEVELQANEAALAKATAAFDLAVPACEPDRDAVRPEGGVGSGE